MKAVASDWLLPHPRPVRRLQKDLRFFERNGEIGRILLQGSDNFMFMLPLMCCRRLEPGCETVVGRPPKMGVRQVRNRLGYQARPQSGDSQSVRGGELAGTSHIVWQPYLSRRSRERAPNRGAY